MMVGSALRDGRSVSRTGAALVVLLAALVHLLACAHGPATAGTVRANVIVAASVTCGPTAGPTVAPATGQTAPAEEAPAQCQDRDELTVQPPRDIAPAADATQEAQPAVRADAVSASVRGGLPPRRGPDASSVQRERALLGVWRT
ncbi:hypothetical protein OH715_06485 [Streptomyces cellulosae]|nr:hypothetical protein OH715_06485 [Streptomyces cellulosae]